MKNEASITITIVVAALWSLFSYVRFKNLEAMILQSKTAEDVEEARS